MSHTLMLLSLEPETMVLPSLDIATLETLDLCPVSVLISSPLSVSHILMLLSPEPEIMVLPSLEIATLVTELFVLILNATLTYG